MRVLTTEAAVALLQTASRAQLLAGCIWVPLIGSFFTAIIRASGGGLWTVEIGRAHV